MHNGNEWLSPNVVGTNRVSNLWSICRNSASFSLVCRKLLRIVAFFIPRQYVRQCQKCLLRTENLGVHLLCCCPSVTGVAVRWRIVGDMTGWLGSSVVECSHGQRKALGSSHIFSPATNGAQQLHGYCVLRCTMKLCFTLYYDTVFYTILWYCVFYFRVLYGVSGTHVWTSL